MKVKQIVELKVPPGGFRGGFQLTELAGSKQESCRGVTIGITYLKSINMI